MTNEVSQLRTPREVAALVCGIAPRTARVPVPSRALQFSILPIGDRPPSGRKRFFQNVWRVDFVHNALGKYVNRAAESYIGIEGLDLRSEERRVGKECRFRGEWER